VNRHFDMLFIHEELSQLMKKDVHCRSIWKHLETLYDMEALHENEQLPFPNSTEEFSLPVEFDELKQQRMTSTERSPTDTSGITSDAADDSNSSGRTPSRPDGSAVKTKVKTEERRETRDKDRPDDTKTPKPKRNVKDVRSEDKSINKTSAAKKRRSQAQ
jgi:MRG-binding protein